MVHMYIGLMQQGNGIRIDSQILEERRVARSPELYPIDNFGQLSHNL